MRDPVAANAELASGSAIAGRYTIGCLAGQGGMGAVYRAVDQRTGERVALKLLTAAFRDATARFEREAALLAVLDHPGIARHVDHGRADDGSPFLVMEWIDGEDLAARLTRGPLSLEDALALVPRVALALAEVHARGIVHRDVKPSNIFLRDGAPARPVLLDFGVARRVDPTIALTRTGGILGTPQYMSPEQVRGDREVGPPSDVFSLGCVLFECLAGRPAFLGENAMAVLAKILLEDPPPLSIFVPAAPRALESLLCTMLRKDAGDRPASCQAIAEQLDPTATMAPTSTGHGASSPSLGGRERGLVSVVLARDGAGPADQTIATDDVSRHWQELMGSLAALGARVAPLGGSNLAITFPPAALAVDQATSAARCAHVVARALPRARIAIAMGWGEVAPVPVGEVIDRAALALARGDEARIEVDDVSAGLLELRFELEGAPGRWTLGPERSSMEPPRTLLGRVTPCVGRDRELGVLAGLMAEVAGDEVARVAHVVAPAGAGKSRLRHEASARIARDHPGALVLLARADVLRANASLDMLGQLVLSAAGVRSEDAPEEARERLVARARAASHLDRDPVEIAALLGEIASIPFDDAASARLAAARRDNRVIGELMLQAWLHWLEAELAERPVVLVLEDLHWADPQTVRYVDLALRDLASRPLLVLALSRPDVRERFPSLWRERSVQEIALPPLTPRAAERLVRAALADLPTGDVDRIVAQGEGNPLYLEEIIRAAASGEVGAVPGTVVAMIHSRLGSFDAGVRRVMRAASVFGQSFRVDDLRALVGEAGVDAAVDLLVEREVLSRARIDARDVAFRHALLREAAYAMFTPSDRAHAHLLAAQHLADRGVNEAVVLAEHFDLGEDRQSAGRWYAEAARQALRKNDFDAAIARANAALERSGAVDVRGTALGARGKALSCQGLFVDAVRDLEEAVALSATGDVSRRFELLEDLWFVATFRQDAVILRAAAHEALSLAEATGRADLAAEAQIGLATADYCDGDCGAWLERFRGAIGSVRERPSLMVGLASTSLYHVGAFAEGERLARKMEVVASDLGDVSTQVVLVANLGLLRAAQGHYQEAWESFERGRVLAMRFGLKTLLARTVSMSAGYPLDVYDYAECARRAEETSELGRALEFATPRINAGLDLAFVAVRRGNAEQALDLVGAVDAHIANGPGFHGWIWRSRMAVLFAEVLAARGDWAGALDLANGCIAGCRPLLRVKYRLLAEHVRARALAALGRGDEAVESATASLVEARSYPDPAMRLRAATTLLELSADERARTDLVDAASAIERGLPTEAARATFRANAPLSGVR